MGSGAMIGRPAPKVYPSDIPLEFLGRGEFIAEIDSDAADANESPKHVVREEKRVNAAARLHVKMAPGGGRASASGPCHDAGVQGSSNRRRKVQLLAESTVVDLLKQFLFPDDSQKPPKSELRLRQTPVSGHRS